MVEKLKVLVVDDATFMVKAIQEILETDPNVEVVGTARNGQEGLDMIKERKPDVVTLDIDMPIMDGIRAIRHIMIEAPRPIVVLSSLFNDGGVTFEALRLGVVDFIPKPSGAVSKDIENGRREIIDRVKIATAVNMENIRRVRLTPWSAAEGLSERYGFQPLEYLLVMGTTLSGPNTFIRVLSHLPSTLPAAVVVVQEISPKILPAFVRKFDEFVPWKISIAKDNLPLEQGTCYVCSNEHTLQFDSHASGDTRLRVNGRGNRPLNALFASAADVFQQHTIGVLLTGVGDDGAEGFSRIREQSGITIAQSIETCVYPNLTHNVISNGLVDVVAEENKMAGIIEFMMREAV